MARKPRMDLGGYCYHLVQRGNNKQDCFFADRDYEFYLQSMALAADKYGVAIHAYVLMTNHVHILVTPKTDGGIGQLMQSVGRRYVRYVNREYNRTGTLWEGRFKSSLVDADQYLLRCYRYIELNPVRAGMVERPSHYPWSSARWHGFGDNRQMVVDHPLYLALGSTPEKRQLAYRALFRESL